MVDFREPVLFDVPARTAKVIDRTLFPNPYALSRFEWYADSPPAPHNFTSVPPVTSARPLRDLRMRIKEQR